MSDGWTSALQKLPNLTAFEMMGAEPESRQVVAAPEFYAALQGLPSLCTLAPKYCYRYSLLADLTRLKDLTLDTPGERKNGVWTIEPAGAQHPSMQGSGPAVLSRLTGLTALCIESKTSTSPPDLWQAQLTSALTALTSLRRLALPRVWEGPVAGALGQMAGLTQLVLSWHQPEMSGLTFPRLKLLTAASVDLGFLSNTKAPQLESLQTTQKRGYTALYRMYLALQLPEARTQQQLQQLSATLELCCTQGVLKHCNRLSIWPRADGTSQAATSALRALGRWWRPDPSLVDGSSPHVQTNAPTPFTHTADGWHL
jgi:hypothetical protein